MLLLLLELRRAFALAKNRQREQVRHSRFLAKANGAGGVEPPSEKRYGPKTTCSSLNSVCFASLAQMMSKKRDRLARLVSLSHSGPKLDGQAYCVTPLAGPVGEARGRSYASLS